MKKKKNTTSRQVETYIESTKIRRDFYHLEMGHYSEIIHPSCVILQPTNMATDFLEHRTVTGAS